MRRLTALSALILLSTLWSQCREDARLPLSDYRPILMERSDLEQSLRWQSPRPIKNLGKVSRYKDYLFINEPFEGQHVFDNSQAENPVALGFIQLPGNMDMAVLNEVIYLDQAVDVVCLRFDGSSVEEVARWPQIYSEAPAPDGGFMSTDEETSRPEGSVIVKWVLRD